MSEGTIDTTRDGHIATLTLNRPDKLNALTMGMLRQLDTVLAEIEADTDIRVVVLTGAGERAFCVGADIHAWAGLEPLDMWRQWIREGHRIFNRLATLRVPVIAALNGYTFGGGLELALTADLRLAADTAQLALPEVKIGTLPGWGGTQRLPALIGRGRAKFMIYTGNRIAAPQAEQWGLVNSVVSAADLIPEAKRLAHEIAQNAPLSVQMAKQAIDSRTDPSMALEAFAGSVAAFSHDGQEGIASFKERRAPQFQGR